MRSLTVLSVAALLFPLGGCTAKYQDMLRDRDAQIRELKGENADLRAVNADLERRMASAPATPQPVEAAVTEPELEKVQSELADLDVRYSRGRLSIGIENTVTFSSGSTQLKSSAGQVLRRVADVLRREFPERRIYVEGHTDTDPIKRTAKRFRSNRHLSAERADAVAEYLVDKGGIDQAKIVVVGFGPFDPRDDGRGDAAKARNRRVEIVVGESL